MPSINKVVLIGHLGRDPEVRVAPSGDSFCTVSIATTETWKDRQTGEKKMHTEWHRIVFSGRLAEVAGLYLRKGRAIYVEGSLRTRKWTGRDGVEHATVEVRADQMQMLDTAESRARGDEGSGEKSLAPAAAQGRVEGRSPLSPFDPFNVDDDPPF